MPTWAYDGLGRTDDARRHGKAIARDGFAVVPFDASRPSAMGEIAETALLLGAAPRPRGLRTRAPGGPRGDAPAGEPAGRGRRRARRTIMRPLLLPFLVLALLPAAASAGGWASADILNAPDRLAAGETWTAQVRILQHGRTPMTGIRPAVVVGSRRFPAKPVAGRPGVYSAEVVFPRAGRHAYRVDDGFTNAVPHTFPAVDVRPAATGAGDAPGFPYLPVLGGLLAAGVAGTLLLRRPVPA